MALVNDNWKNQGRDRKGRFTRGMGGKTPKTPKRISPAEEARQDQIAVPQDSGPNPPKGLSGAKLAAWYLKNVPVTGGKGAKPKVTTGPRAGAVRR